MKHLIIAAIGAVLCGCGSGKQLVQAQSVATTYGKEEQLADTFLLRLQQQNDVVLATYTESLGWGRHYNYKIAASKNGSWKGYIYTISGTKANQAVSIKEAAVDKKAADNAALFLNNQALWSGKDNHENCNMQVNDGSTTYLLMAAGNKVLRLGYYMPDIYQQSCPDSSRQLFLDANNKMNELFTKQASR